ncbi:hypothetical protein PoB_004432000 [Plakobranchus ocellatus]|uniref:Uncharacterized protein n=1 Tax=Plakobranchus ocellatus TaxID=259542 RepID=A0AAV4BB21_9GAST|nr:hypothetical protein PoB_004432000 [Plakobranchus ocellatus]
MLDKIEEFENHGYRPNTDLYEIEKENEYCMNRFIHGKGLSAADDDSWKFKSLYVDSIEAFKLPADGSSPLGCSQTAAGSRAGAGSWKLADGGSWNARHDASIGLFSWLGLG